MRKKPQIFDCNQILEQALTKVQGSLQKRIAHNPMIQQFVLDQIQFLDICRHLALEPSMEADNAISPDTKAQGIQESLDWLKILIEQCYAEEPNDGTE